MIDREPFRPTASGAFLAAARLVAPVTVRAGRAPSPPPPPPRAPAASTLPAFPREPLAGFNEPDDDEPSTEELEAAARMLGTDWQIDPRALLKSRGIDPTPILGDPARRPHTETLLGIPAPAILAAARPPAPVQRALPPPPAFAEPSLAALPPAPLHRTPPPPPPVGQPVRTAAAAHIVAPPLPSRPFATEANAAPFDAPVESELDALAIARLVPSWLRLPRARKHRIALLAAAAAGLLVAALTIRSFPGEASSPAASGEPLTAMNAGKSGGRQPLAPQRAADTRAARPVANAEPADTPRSMQDLPMLADPSPASSPKHASKAAAATRPAGATLQISSVPAAKVTVDGRPVGVTPRTVRVEPGLHRVAFIGPNGRRSRNVNVSPGANTSVSVRF